MTNAVGPDTIEALAEKMRQRKQEQGGDKKFPKVVFLPEGEHKGRIINDPVGETYRDSVTRGYFHKGIQDPAHCVDVPDGFNFAELDEIAEELSAYRVFKWGAKKNFLFYFYLTETNAKSENWQPGTLYCVVSKYHVATAFSDLIISIAEDSPTHLSNMLNPEVKGVGVKITTAGMGLNATCSINTLFNEIDPIPTDESYVPLADCYVKDGFNMEKYRDIVKAAREQLDQTRALRRAKGLPLVGDADWATEENNEASGGEANGGEAAGNNTGGEGTGESTGGDAGGESTGGESTGGESSNEPAADAAAASSESAEANQEQPASGGTLADRLAKFKK